jgi:hypothetical protein
MKLSIPLQRSAQNKTGYLNAICIESLLIDDLFGIDPSIDFGKSMPMLFSGYKSRRTPPIALFHSLVDMVVCFG